MKTKTKSKSSREKLGKTHNKPTLVAFLLDRSASMSACRDETISGFNAYIDNLIKGATPDARLTLTQFDTQGIDIIHDAVPLAQVNHLTQSTYQPRASTPLYDAMGKTIAATEKQAGEKYQVLFVTLTDGEENSSSQFDLEKIQDLIKQKESKNKWTFAHIGVGLQGWAQVRRMAANTMSASNVMHAQPGDEKRTYQKFSGQTMSYMRSAGGQSVTNFWGGNDVKIPKPKPFKPGKMRAVDTL